MLVTHLWLLSSALFAVRYKTSSGQTYGMSDFKKQMEKIGNANGFIAALDQSGGSTPKALTAYGYPEDKYVKGEESMYEAVHVMRTRIMTSPSFNGDRILAAILFENTMDRQVDGKPTPTYLWEVKGIVPILKVDKGLEPEKDGVQLMKPIPGLDDLLKRAKDLGVFGTKMRSVINMANAKGVKEIVDQQFEIGKQIITAGLIPILEPEVNIKSPEKAEAEILLKRYLLEHLNALDPDDKVMLKLSLPSVDNFYKECIDHSNVVRVVALSGGYSRDEANVILARQNRMIASFSRALLEGLVYSMSDKDFDTSLNASIQSIFDASKT
jgi:fructose-bisphosphate aldolase class I